MTRVTIEFDIFMHDRVRISKKFRRRTQVVECNGISAPSASRTSDSENSITGFCVDLFTEE